MHNPWITKIKHKRLAYIIFYIAYINIYVVLLHGCKKYITKNTTNTLQKRFVNIINYKNNIKITITYKVTDGIIKHK